MTVIIAGRARGLRLEVPSGRHVRPTLGRVREALFSMLEARLDFDGLHVLDLFAGSGALGLEAWSRGAERVVLVEHDPRTARLIERNARTLGATDDVAVVVGRLPGALTRLPREPAGFDLVLLDPPYAEAALYTATLAALAESGRLAVDALLCVEHDARHEVPLPPGHARRFVHVTTRTRASTAITLFDWPGDAPEATVPRSVSDDPEPRAMKTSRFLDRVQPSATLSISNKAAQLKAAGHDVIGFGAGEPDFNTPEPIIEAAKRALDKGRTKYAPVSGTNELRAAIATWYNGRYGTAIAAENVIVSVGGKHSLYNVARALLDPGDRVVIPSPYWVSYPAQVELCGADPVYVETTEADGFVLTPDALDRALAEHTPRYVILNSPSNPTGMAVDREQLGRLLDVLRNHPDVLLVWDSIYEQLVYDGFEHVEPLQLAPDLADRIVVTSGFSKSYAMTGWRLGYAIAPVKLVKAMSKLQSHMTSGPTTFAMDGAVAAFQLEQAVLDKMLAVFDDRRRRMVELLRAIPHVTVPMPQGAFYAFCNLSAYLGASVDGKTLDDDLAIADYLLDKAGVAIVPGSAFGAPGYARLSYACSLDNIEKGVTRMGEALRALGV